MKKLIFLPMLMLCLYVPFNTSAQSDDSKWVQDESFNDALEADEVNVRSNHGLAVDPDGNVWVQQYYGDSEVNGEATRGIYIYDENNEQIDISPIFVFESEDGSINDPFVNTGLGMTTDYEGNIIVSTFNTLYKLDYKTGKTLAKANVVEDLDLEELPDANQSLTKASADEDGNIYVRSVFSESIPLVKYDSELKNPEVVIEKPSSFSRSFEISADGMTIYHAGYPNGNITRYSKPDQFSGFGAADSVLYGIKSEAFAIHPTTGHLWVGAGSTNDMPDMEKGYVPERFYAFDVDDLGTEAEAPLDSIIFNNYTEDALFTACRPRAIDFAPDGKTAYIGMFECSLEYESVQKFTNDNPPTANEVENALPENYELSQNYPNPFNPTTNIKFTVQDAGMVSIKVYDLAGREVATVANERFTAGSHQVTFDASNLASGVYMYTLEANGIRLTNKMTLIK